MDKDPKKPDDLQDENGQQGMMSTNIPLTIAVSAFINSKTGLIGYCTLLRHW